MKVPRQIAEYLFGLEKLKRGGHQFKHALPVHL